MLLVEWHLVTSPVVTLGDVTSVILSDGAGRSPGYWQIYLPDDFLTGGKTLTWALCIAPIVQIIHCTSVPDHNWLFLGGGGWDISVQCFPVGLHPLLPQGGILIWSLHRFQSSPYIPQPCHTRTGTVAAMTHPKQDISVLGEKCKSCLAVQVWALFLTLELKKPACCSYFRFKMWILAPNASQFRAVISITMQGQLTRVDTSCGLFTRVCLTLWNTSTSCSTLSLSTM